MNDIVSTRNTIVGIKTIVIGTNVLCVDAVPLIPTGDTAELFWREQKHCAVAISFIQSRDKTELFWWSPLYLLHVDAISFI